MASGKRNREIEEHKAWMGFVQPIGLVVSPPALVKAQCVPRRDLIDMQEDLRTLTRTVARTGPAEAPGAGDDVVTLDDFVALAETVLDWQPGDLLGADDPADLPYMLANAERVSWQVVDVVVHGKTKPKTRSTETTGSGGPRWVWIWSRTHPGHCSAL